MLKPTKGNVITTVIFTLLMFIFTYFLELMGANSVNLISFILVKWFFFLFFIFVFYFLSSLIFNNFKWYKVFIFLIMFVIILLSIYPKSVYFSYLFDKSNDCNNHIGGPIARSNLYRQCDCLGTPMRVFGIDQGDSRCFGETKYTYTWNYLKGIDGNYYGIYIEEFRRCNLLLDTDTEECITAIESIDKSKEETVEFSSLDEWHQYCLNLNNKDLLEVCQFSLDSAREYLFLINSGKNPFLFVEPPHNYK